MNIEELKEYIAEKRPDIAEKLNGIIDAWKWRTSSAEILLSAIVTYGEARGESNRGQFAVLMVIFNRAHRRKRSIIDVLLRSWQFSCLNKGDPSLDKAREADTQTIKETIDLASFVKYGHEDLRYIFPFQATVFLTEDAYAKKVADWVFYGRLDAQKTKPGAWDLSKLVYIGREGRHLFFEEI